MFGSEQFEGFDGNTAYRPPEILSINCGLVFLHGSEGGMSGWNSLRAFSYCGFGFTTLAFQYSRGGTIWHAGDIENVELSRVLDALDWMRDLGLRKVGLVGVSRGAEAALIVAWLSARRKNAPDAVATHASVDRVKGPFFGRNAEPFDPGSVPTNGYAWLWEGKTKSIEPETPIEIELYSRPLLLTHGEQDEIWSADYTRALFQRFTDHGLKSAQIEIYQNQGHGFDLATLNIHRLRTAQFFKQAFSQD